MTDLEKERETNEKAQVEKELIIHGIQSNPVSQPEPKKDGKYILALLDELKPHGYAHKNGDISKATRQIAHANSKFLPITVIFKNKEIVDNIVATAKAAK